MISHDTIEEAAYAIMAKAAIDIPEDYFNGIKGMIDVEKGDLSTFVLKAMVDNYEAATEDRRPEHRRRHVGKQVAAPNTVGHLRQGLPQLTVLGHPTALADEGQ